MAILGLRGSGNWESDQRPKSWREGTLLLEPNGEVDLFALTSRLKEQQITDPEHSWWEKTLSQDSATVTGVYETSGLSNAYDASDDYAAGSLVYVKMAAASASDFGRNDVVRFYAVDGSGNYAPGTFTPINGIVMQRQIDGANSYLTVKLLEADGQGNGDLSASNLRLMIIGSAFAEGSEWPQSIGYNPTKRTNYTQIFIRSYRGTRTMMRTKVRTGDQKAESKRETLQYLNIGVEQALHFGTPTESIDPETGMPWRTMGGVYHYLKTYNSSGIVDYTQDTGYSGLDWTVGGEDWLDYQVEQLFRYGTSTEKLCYCGPGALTAINQIAKSKGFVELPTMDIGYGSKVKRWETPHGDLLLKKHPLYNKHPDRYNAIFCMEPKNIKYLYIDDVTFINDKNRNGLQGGGPAWLDGIIEGWLCEISLEVAFPQMFRYLSGVGLNNAL